MRHILVKGTYMEHQTQNFVVEIRFSFFKEKVGQLVCLRQVHDQHGLVGTTGSSQMPQVIFLPLFIPYLLFFFYLF